VTQDVAYHQIKSGWVFKALTPVAREKFLKFLNLPERFVDGDVFIQNVAPDRFTAMMAALNALGLNTDKPEPVKVDAKRYTDF
jgi:hypothetical protein